MTEEKKEEMRTPDTDSKINPSDVDLLSLAEAKRKLVSLKKEQQKRDKKIADLESKNPVFSVAYQEKVAFERAEKDFTEAQRKGATDMELERVQAKFEAARSAYTRTYDKMDDKQKADFVGYCGLSDAKKENQVLIKALEEKAKTKGSSKRKALSVLGSLLILGGVAGYFAVQNKEAKPTQAKIEQVANQGEQTPTQQTTVQNPAPQTAEVAEQPTDPKLAEAVQNFNTAIAKYPPQTQEAMRMSIDWLKKYNAFTKARATKDDVARLQAKLEMDAYKAGIQQLDNNVWIVINNKMGPDFVAQDKENPGVTFNLVPVYQLLPQTYDSVVAAQTQTQTQTQTQAPRANAPKPEYVEQARANPAVVGGDYNKAIAYSVQMLQKMDLFFTMHSINPNDGALLSLNREMADLSQRIEQAQPALYAYVAKQSQQLLQNYTQTGIKPDIRIDAFERQLTTVASDLQANPQKAIDMYAALLQQRAEQQSQQNRNPNPALQRGGNGGR